MIFHMAYQLSFHSAKFLMEKYGSFSDKATGVRPFIPITHKISKHRLYFQYFLGAFKFIASLPFFLTMFLNPFLFQFVPIWPVRVFITRFCHILHGMITSCICGSYWVPAVPTPLINKIIEPEKWKRPTHGDVIFAPLNSFLDLIWLSVRMSPVFMIPTGEDSAVVYSLFPLMFRLLLNLDLRNGGTKVVISEYLKTAKPKRKFPIVIFAEAAPTNGTGILKYQKINCEVPETTKVQVLGFKREFTGVSPNRVSGSLVKYVLQIFGRFYEKATVLVALEKDVEQPNGKFTPEYLEKIRVVTGKLLKLPLLELDADSYVQFIKVYNNGGKVKSE